MRAKTTPKSSQNQAPVTAPTNRNPATHSAPASTKAAEFIEEKPAEAATEAESTSVSNRLVHQEWLVNRQEDTWESCSLPGFYLRPLLETSYSPSSLLLWPAVIIPLFLSNSQSAQKPPRRSSSPLEASGSCSNCSSSWNKPTPWWDPERLSCGQRIYLRLKQNLRNKIQTWESEHLVCSWACLGPGRELSISFEVQTSLKKKVSLTPSLHTLNRPSLITGP